MNLLRRRFAAGHSTCCAPPAPLQLYIHVTFIVIDAECAAFFPFGFTDPFRILRYYLFDHYNKYEICGDGDGGGGGLCSILSIGDLRL